jgi:hypothetical protein
MKGEIFSGAFSRKVHTHVGDELFREVLIALPIVANKIPDSQP